MPLIFIQLKAKARKVVEIETALRIGDLVALRELAAQKHGLVEGKFSTQLKILKLFFSSVTRAKIVICDKKTV